MAAAESILLAYLANSLWQAPLLALVAWLAARIARRAGPAIEHRIWVAALVAQSMLPAFALLHWERVGALFAWSVSATANANGQIAISVDAAARSGIASTLTRLLPLLVAAYAIAVAYFAARLCWHWAKLASLLQQAEDVPAEGALAEAWARNTQRFGIRKARLLFSAHIAGPVTVGWRRQILLMPTGITARLDEFELSAIFAHECAHMQRNDFARNLLYEALMLPVRYHPACWLARERVIETREQVCDAIAAEIDGRRIYARSLLKLAELLVGSSPMRTPHAIGIFDTQTFERRVMRLAEKRTELSRAKRLAMVAFSAVLSVATCTSALALGMRINSANATTTEKPKAVPSGEMVGNLISKVTPVYPPEAKKAHIQGKVKLSAIIGKTGDVEQLHVLSGPKELQQSAMDAVRQWKYKPYTVNGAPVEVETTINITYSLAK